MEKLNKFGSWTTEPKVGDKIKVKIDGIEVVLVTVPKTACTDCYLYDRSERKQDPSTECFNFSGNNREVWMNCSRKYRSGKDSVMFILDK